MMDILFLIAAICSVVGAITVVSQKNPVYSALGLIGSFIAVAVIYLLLHAPFLAVIQIAVYAGAIVVLFLFVIMLLNLKPEELGVDPTVHVQRRVALGSLALFLLLAGSFATAGLGAVPFADESVDPNFGSTVAIGEALMGNYLLPFEVTSVLIIVAIVGAVVLAKRKL